MNTLKKNRTWFILLALALVALALTFIPRPEEHPETPIPPSPTSVAVSESHNVGTAVAPTAEPTAPALAATASPAPTRAACTEPEPVLVAAKDVNGTPLPPPIGAGGVFKIEAAPCTRELVLRDFAEIFRFWSNVDGNPFKRKPGYEERWNYFVKGQPAGEMWDFNTRYYAENKSGYVVWEPRGYEPEKVEAVYQDPTGMTVWIFYRRGMVTAELRKIADGTLVETYEGDQGLMRWMLQWQNGRYLAVAYESKVSLP